MLGRKEAPTTLLTVVGETAKMEGKFANMDTVDEESTTDTQRPLYLLDEKRAGQGIPR